MKKILLTVVVAILLASCAANSNVNIDEPDPKGPLTDNEPKEDVDFEQEKYTGEIIVDGFYRGRIYFLPDKETKLLLKDKHGREVDDSIPLYYNDTAIEAQLPKELGIYKAEVMADFSQEGWLVPLNEIELTDNIGTVEYEGKEYETNDLDETVRAKDRVCGLIVSHVRRFEDGGVIIEFEGEIESEGFYSVYPGGEFYNNIKMGRIVPDEESLKHFPSYLGKPNNFSVYFTETNDLYNQLAEFSAVGKGKFNSADYSINYNYGTEAAPGEVLAEIISLDEKYKGLFKFNDTKITKILANESTKYTSGFTEKYAIVYDANNLDKNMTEPRDYYFFHKENASKIKLLTTDEFDYILKESTYETGGNEFVIESDGHNYKSNTYERPHSINFKYLDENKSGIGKEAIIKNYNYGYFIDKNEAVRVVEGDTISGMTASDINIEYRCTSDSPEELIRIRCYFTGETSLTGKLTSYYSEIYGMNMVYFTADNEGLKKLPHHADDIRDRGFIVFNNENLKEMLGTEPFEKSCEIVINNYMIYMAAKDVHDTADLISVSFLE